VRFGGDPHRAFGASATSRLALRASADHPPSRRAPFGGQGGNMSAVLETEVAASVEVEHPDLRTIKVGIAGLGQVGQAVARLAPDTTRLKDAGYRFRIVGALVRDIDKPRRCQKPSRVTTNPAAFLRGHYDVVIEALAAIEPARSLVSRLLGRGVPVVTANKALVAAHGRELSALAARRGTTLRYEASALAGIPFLGALAARPLVSDVHQFAAIVNGTSNFILSKLESENCTFDAALTHAQALGLTEPDPSRDLDGLDATDKLTLLSSLFGWGTLPVAQLDVHGIRGITHDDFAIARTFDSTIKPVVFATHTAVGVSAFVGPAMVPANHSLAALRGTLSGIHLSGRFVSDLFFSGPGAGPEVTAATMIDDAVEAVASVPRPPRVPLHPSRIATVAPAPATRWLVRATFPGLVPDAPAATYVFATHHLHATHVTDAIGNTRWLLVAPVTRDVLDTALSRITSTHRIHTFAIRSL
jgi:homoserine dehydrogenase